MPYIHKFVFKMFQIQLIVSFLVLGKWTTNTFSVGFDIHLTAWIGEELKAYFYCSTYQMAK